MDDEMKDIIESCKNKMPENNKLADLFEQRLKRITDPVTVDLIEDFDEHVKKAAAKPEQLPLGLLPTDFCRTTFCKPFRRRDMRPPEDINQEIFESSWGRVEYLGPDCGIEEEDLIIVLLRRWVRKGFPESYHCQYADILDDLGYKRNKRGYHEARNIRRLKQMLKRITYASFTCIFYKGKGKNRKKVTSGFITHAVAAGWDDEKQAVKVVVNHWWASTIGRGFVTGINLEERRELKGKIAKALHRFLSSHSSMNGQINIFVLAQVLGLNTRRQKIKIREELRIAVSELKRIGFLERKTRISKDILYWYRARKVFSGPPLIESLQQQKDIKDQPQPPHNKK